MSRRRCACHAPKGLKLTGVIECSALGSSARAVLGHEPTLLGHLGAPLNRVGLLQAYRTAIAVGPRQNAAPAATGSGQVQRHRRRRARGVPRKALLIREGVRVSEPDRALRRAGAGDAMRSSSSTTASNASPPDQFGYMKATIGTAGKVRELEQRTGHTRTRGRSFLGYGCSRFPQETVRSSHPRLSMLTTLSA